MRGSGRGSFSFTAVVADMGTKVPGYPPVAPSTPAVAVTWATLSGKPATFPPSAHTHAYGDLTGIPASFPPAVHTHAWADITGKPNLYAPSAHTHLWADITDKPTSFTPSAHSHAWGDITGKPTTFSPSAHTHLWADITDKPTTFPPSTHTHSYNDLTDKPSLTGRLVFLGNINVAETLLISLAVGMKRKTFALAGVAVGDILIAIPTAAPTTGCEVVNAYPASAGNVSIGYYTPLLGIGASYAMPIALFKVT